MHFDADVIVVGAGAAGCLQDPVGRVYFAGTETALQWRGYVEGALESGERQASKIASALGK